MKKVITYGTFDLLHWGHIKLLERAKQLGDYLVVAISTDEFNLQKQKKLTIAMSTANLSWKPSVTSMKSSRKKLGSESPGCHRP